MEELSRDVIGGGEGTFTPLIYEKLLFWGISF